MMNKKGFICLGIFILATVFIFGQGVNAQESGGAVTATTVADLHSSKVSNIHDVVLGAAVTIINSTNQEYAEILKQLEDIDVQQEAIDKQKAELKLQYRNGQITREQYLVQMTELEKKEEELDKQEDALEVKLDSFKQQTNLNNGNMVVTPSTGNTSAADINTQNATMEQALTKLSDLDKQEDELDRLEDELEFKYRSGQITRDSFISQMQELERRERELDIEEDAWESQMSKIRAGQASGGNNTASASNEANIEAQEEALERQEDELERQYRNGGISRQEFYKRKAQLEAREDALERQEDAYDNDDDDDDDDDYDDYDDYDDDVRYSGTIRKANTGTAAKAASAVERDDDDDDDDDDRYTAKKPVRVTKRVNDDDDDRDDDRDDDDDD